MARDPVPRYRAWLVAQGHATEAQLAGMEAEKHRKGKSTEAFKFAMDSPFPMWRNCAATSTATRWQHERRRDYRSTADDKVNMLQAINWALDDALTTNPRVLVFGEDVADPKRGVVGITRGLSTKHGGMRVRSTPISEQAIIGAASARPLPAVRPVPRSCS